MNQLVPVASATSTSAGCCASERAGMRFLEFFAGHRQLVICRLTESAMG